MAGRENKVVELHIQGIVQGVGFRPFIARLAVENHLCGSVSNAGGGVLVVVSGTDEDLMRFEKRILQDKSQSSEIIFCEKKQLKDDIGFVDFRIIESSEGGCDMVFIPPDFSICENCRKELFNPSDKRYLHPFISCMECGPRYSIIDRIPYDRGSTSMIDFTMCGYCKKQYGSIGERRYHAQTISCRKCGPQLLYRGADKVILYRDKAFGKAVEILQNGGILAIKGIGGYHLACSAFSDTAVEGLREVKGREAKPFAVMFRDIEQLMIYCEVSREESFLLQSRESPIVLLKRKASDISGSVYEGSRSLGAFLSYTPLQCMLLKDTGPLVMTSANLSGRPIIIEDCQMLTMLNKGVDGVLYNERKIRTGIDDSVVKADGYGMRMIRRGRGYAPLPIIIKDSDSGFRGSILACGGQTKNTFCLASHSSRIKGSLAYMSQHIGDLEDVDTYKAYVSNIKHLESLLGVVPERVCCDMHKGYTSAKYAHSLGLEVKEVQHHYAHIASVMAERGIYDEVIGIAYDGTGYGTDGKIWGGEFLLCGSKGFKRAAHLEYIPMLGGDASIMEAWKSAYMYLYRAGLETYIVGEEWKLLRAAVINNVNMIESSSMGRLFDAVSSILDIKHASSYEGECAVLLENKAAEYLDSRAFKNKKPYKYDIIYSGETYNIRVLHCIREILNEKSSGVDAAETAYRFHSTIAAFTAEVCRCIRDKYCISKVALSGGVFQNSLLFQLVIRELSHNGFEVFYNRSVPSNDGGIALGQAYVGIFGV